MKQESRLALCIDSAVHTEAQPTNLFYRLPAKGILPSSLYPALALLHCALSFTQPLCYAPCQRKRRLKCVRKARPTRESPRLRGKAGTRMGTEERKICRRGSCASAHAGAGTVPSTSTLPVYLQEQAYTRAARTQGASMCPEGPQAPKVSFPFVQRTSLLPDPQTAGRNGVVRVEVTEGGCVGGRGRRASLISMDFSGLSHQGFLA